MTRRRLLAFSALAVLALLVWRFGSLVTDAPPASAGRPAATSPTATATAPDRPAVPATPPAERSTLADALNAPTADIRADLRLVSEILDTFRTNFPRDGNPVGNNAEITAVLAGQNKLRLALIPPDHPAINRAGELCDRWGTPFFFHAESATRMDLRSAGPDRKLWTDDDVVHAP